MQVTRTSPFTGIVNTMELDVTQEQIDELVEPDRRLVQDIFPELTPMEREFITAGYTQEDWDQMFAGEEE